MGRLAQQAARLALWVGLALTFAGTGCGGGAAEGGPATTPRGLTAAQIDADPLALLPASAVIVATVDARAFYTSGSLGAELAALEEQVVPIGEEAGFRASRDVDRVVLGTYATEGLDVAAVVSGRFDEAKIKQAADAHTQTRGGGVIAASQYAGRSVYTVNNVGFCVLTAKTALAGTETGIRRALERIHDGAVKREFPSWAQETLDTPNAAATLAADLEDPTTSALFASVPAWAKAAKAVRAVADFKPPGMHVAGTLTYADAQGAAAGAGGMQQLGTMANLLALTGVVPRLQDLAIGTTGLNVTCSFSLDDSAMKSLLSTLRKWVR